MFFGIDMNQEYHFRLERPQNHGNIGTVPSIYFTVEYLRRCRIPGTTSIHMENSGATACDNNTRQALTASTSVLYQKVDSLFFFKKFLQKSWQLLLHEQFSCIVVRFGKCCLQF